MLFNHDNNPIDEEDFIQVDSSCIGCGCCESVCPVGAIEVGLDDVASWNKDLCIGCEACVGACPLDALTTR